MQKIAYILLCHEDPDAIIAQAQYLTQSGDYLAIHFDKCSAVAEIPNAVLCRKRIKCAWSS